MSLAQGKGQDLGCQGTGMSGRKQ